MTRQLGIFAKFWEPGRVKTRLAASCGDVRASEIYRLFVETLLTRLATVEADGVLSYTPPEKREEFAAIASPSWRLESQCAGDLGRRMRHYFQQALDRGNSQAVLIGSDSPQLEPAHIEAAFTALADVPVVLGPSLDGGYYLIGVSGEVPPIFEGMPWSTPDLWEATTTRLREIGLPFVELPATYDVDDIHDLRRLREDLREKADPTCARLLALLDEIADRFTGEN